MATKTEKRVTEKQEQPTDQDMAAEIESVVNEVQESQKQMISPTEDCPIMREIVVRDGIELVLVDHDDLKAVFAGLAGKDQTKSEPVFEEVEVNPVRRVNGKLVQTPVKQLKRVR